MTRTILRGRVLSFFTEPEAADDHASYRFLEDGGVLIEDGTIVAVEEYAALAHDGAETIDHRPHLILPGFIDPHIHFPQMQVIGSYAGSLLEWLSKYTFVEELRFASEAHAARIASAFFDELVRNGTTTAASYCSVHPQSADAYFAEAMRRDMLMVGGKVLMDRNAPEGLCDTPQSCYDDTVALIDRWHGKGRCRYAVTPRFAITSSPEQLDMARALVSEHPECHVQTHLSESMGEIDLARELYPERSDYTDIYAHYGLLGPRTLLGHCIHLSHRETEAIAESGAVAVFCPTSNLFIGSGLFDYERLHRHGVRIAIATDVGGGTSYSMLRTLDEGYKVLQTRGQRLNPLRAFYMATLGNARALSLDARIGSLRPGNDADLVVLDARSTPQMALRMETVASLGEELFLLQTCGDDRAVVETYAAGRALKSGLGAYGRGEA